MSGNGSQLWFVEGSVGPVGNLSEIVNVASGFCLDSRGEIGGHLQLVIEPCNGSAGQQWDLKYSIARARFPRRRDRIREPNRPTGRLGLPMTRR